MSWQATLISSALRRWIKPDSRREQSIRTMRSVTARVPFGAKLAPGWRLRVDDSAPFKGEWIERGRNDDPSRQRCILYLHGGGYVGMSPQTHRAITSRLALWSDASLFALDYRLAPEYPFPAALDDAVAAYQGLLDQGRPANRIAIAGDSAGGGLAMATLVALRRQQIALPAAAVLFSPWTDLAVSGQSIIENDAHDALIHGAWVKRLTKYYLAGASATDPLVSPLYADLAGLPPLLIQVSDTEVLRDDSLRLAERALQADVPTTLQRWPHLPHGWQIFATILPEARAALRDAAVFIRTAIGPPGLG
jgi:epsilon-lactone hydrolase